MNINKLMHKLDDYFDLSKKKQNEKHDKLLKIIRKLEERKTDLKAEMVLESEKDETSEEFNNLKKEIKVISKLLKKAKQNNAAEDEE